MGEDEKGHGDIGLGMMGHDGMRQDGDGRGCTLLDLHTAQWHVEGTHGEMFGVRVS